MCMHIENINTHACNSIKVTTSGEVCEQHTIIRRKRPAPYSHSKPRLKSGHNFTADKILHLLTQLFSIQFFQHIEMLQNPQCTNWIRGNKFVMESKMEALE